MFFNKKSLIFLIIFKLFFSIETIFSKEYRPLDVYQKEFYRTPDTYIVQEKVLSNFKKLPEKKEIINKNKLGKIDPFDSNENTKNLKFGNVKLLGVFSYSSKNYALLQFNDLVGQIEEGEIGGNDTSLLPNDVLLKKIYVDSSSIILEFNNKEYTLSI